EAFTVGDTDETPLDVVRPAVERAREPARPLTASRRHDFRTPVLAHVQERAQAPATVPREQDRRARSVECLPRPPTGQVAAEPHERREAFEEQPALLLPELL